MLIWNYFNKEINARMIGKLHTSSFSSKASRLTAVTLITSIHPDAGSLAIKLLNIFNIKFLFGFHK